MKQLQKQIVFNVGGALSTYIEFDNKKLLVDIGANSDFNPIKNFLLPLYQKRDDRKCYIKGHTNKYHIDQLIISHPHKDHLSAIEDFDEYFYPELLTTPNDNPNMEKYGGKINWKLIGNETESYMVKFRKMLEGRQPPLRATSDQNEFIFFLNPKDVENDTLLSTTEKYPNNISIVVFLIINNHRVFLPGDIQKEGMKKIINDNHFLLNKLKGGVDVLIAPHHGLRSSFSTYLFEKMKNGKTRCINIISEKANNPDDNRNVDTRYSEYCIGENNLYGTNSYDRYSVKTSNGHIVINYEKANTPTFHIHRNIEETFEYFI